MEEVEDSVQLSAAQTTAILRGLNEEYRQVRLGPAARFFFRSLTIVAYLLPAVLLLTLLGQALSSAAKGKVISLGSFHPFLNVQVRILESWILPLVVAVIVLGAANLPLARRAYRHWLLARRLVAIGLVDNLFRKRSRPARWRRFLRILLYLPPAFFLLVFLWNLPRATAQVAWWPPLVVLLLLAVLPWLLLRLDRIFERLEIRLAQFEEIEFLKKSLLSAKSEDGLVSLQHDLVDRIARAERVQLLEETAEQLGEAGASPQRAYVFHKKSQVLHFLRGLDPPARIAVEAALEDLAARHQSGEVPAFPDLRHVELAGLNFVAVYGVEPETRILRLELIMRKPRTRCGTSPEGVP